jgi:TP53 regulating kinase and related kinases
VIDFGLAHFSVSPEDRAVDLYVLERACGSAHSDISPRFFDAILRGYLACLAPDVAKPVAAKFEAVRQRGRKRLAFG